MNEFALIERYFKPLASHFSGSLGLTDDAALIDPPIGQQLIVTKDAISEGIHYLPETEPALIAKKLLRTNLSDLAAMGASPYCYFLSIALSAHQTDAFIAAFAEGLREDQDLFGLHLAGGDSIRSQGAAVFSITALGLLPKGTALRRNGAKPGDHIYVTGSLGDAALGLHYLQQQPNHFAEAEHLIHRYHLPLPRLEMGAQLRGIATSCMDISDGLLQDMGHLCHASNVGADLHCEVLPLSPAAKRYLAHYPELMPLVYSGGDDYELLFTLPAGVAPPPEASKIGQITAEQGVRLFQQGQLKNTEKQGYTHFSAG